MKIHGATLQRQYLHIRRRESLKYHLDGRRLEQSAEEVTESKQKGKSKRRVQKIK
jgi:hypothetical protein